MIPKSISIIKKGLPEVLTLLNQYNWDVTQSQFSMILSMVFYPADSVRFTPLKGQHPIELYKNGIVQSFIDVKVLEDKESIIDNALDEVKNPLFRKLGKVFDTAFTWRKFLIQMVQQNPFLFSNDKTVQYQLDVHREMFVDLAVNDMLAFKNTNIFMVYEVLHPKLEKFVRNEVARITEEHLKSQTKSVEKPEKEEVVNFSYLTWKSEHKKRMDDKIAKRDERSAETDDPKSEIGRDDSESEYDKLGIHDKQHLQKRRLKRTNS